ncbi:hypothetical protein HPB50_003353 [Hyalomma asiaticum]|uniref:Uncharacterized protein n=1 Tax=Hyalomma asiaticum TaxID=266040 RepID=A0ACB7T3A3_HYAAI|nr:hypothetical protein HPB50_003353 [Hyalomma asiaticum]
MDTCPNPRPDACGLCGQQVPPVEEGLSVWSVSGGAHATNSRAYAAKFCKSMATAQQGEKLKKAAKKRRQLQPLSEPPRWDIATADKPTPRNEGDQRQPLARPTAHGGTRKQPTAKPCGEAESRTRAVKSRSRVSGKGRAASSSSAILPSSAINAEKSIIVILRAQIEALQKRLAAVDAKHTQQVSAQ